jgi:hypothetical protein
MIFTIHKIYLTGQFDTILLLTYKKLFAGECFPFAKVYENNIGNVANLDHVIDETSTVLENLPRPQKVNVCLP